MKSKSNSKWQINLGLLQVLVLVGVVTGSMLGAFSIGYLSGNAVGFESAQSSNVVTLARFPVERDNDESDYVSEVYAKLNDRKPKENSKANKKADSIPETVPVLEATDDILDELVNEQNTGVAEDNTDKTAELTNVDLEQSDNKEPQETIETLAANKEQSTAQGLDVALLGGGKKESKPTTLGMLLEKQEQGKKQATDTETKLDDHKNVVSKETENEVAKVEEPTADKELGDQKKSPSSDTSVSDKKLAVVPPKPEQEESQKIAPGWYAQVLAPRELSEAELMSKKLKESGFPVIIERAQVRGQQYYRVLVGGEETRTQAEILIKQLKREKYLAGEPFLRLLR